MKYTSLRAFEKHLEGASPNHFSNVYMIISKEEFDCKNAANLLIAQLLKGKSQRELYIKTFSADNLNLNELLSETNTLSLFADKQIILLQNADKLAAASRTALEAIVEKPPKSLYLIISAPSINHATNFYKKSEKNGIILEIPELKPWEKEKSIADWVTSQAAALGKKMNPQASQFLVKQVGIDQTTLNSELEKLCCYIGDRPDITLNDIGAICASVNFESIWQLGEAIFRRDAKTALRITKSMLNDGSGFIGLLKQIRYQFQTEFQICSILAGGGTSSDVTQKFPYMKGTILDRHIQNAQQYGLGSFKKGMHHIDSIEIMAKNSVSDHDLLAELLIAKLVV